MADSSRDWSEANELDLANSGDEASLDIVCKECDRASHHFHAAGETSANNTTRCKMELEELENKRIAAYSYRDSWFRRAINYAGTKAKLCTA